MNAAVYTRKWVVDLMLDLVGYVPGSGITGKVLVEPSCGDGAFLASIAERLATEVLCDGRAWSAIADAVVACEILKDPADKARETVCSVLRKHGCPHSTALDIANTWVRNSDFILSALPGCSYVVGNPPYVRATEIHIETRKVYAGMLSSFTNGCDLYIAFFDKGLDLLNDNGKLCYICSDRWLQNGYGKRLRIKINERFNLTTLISMHGADAFERNVTAYPVITVISNDNRKTETITYVKCTGKIESSEAEYISHGKSSKNLEVHEIARPKDGDVYSFGSEDEVSYITAITERLPGISDAGISVGIGIATGCDSVFITDDDTVAEPSRLLPLFIMRDYRKNIKTKKWLVNPWEDNGTLVDLEKYPLLKKYLKSHESRLRNRYIVRRNTDCWYRTIDKVNRKIIGKELLLIPDMAMDPDPVLVSGCYPHHNCYWLYSDVWDMKALGGILMSDTVRKFISSKCVKMNGGTLRFQAQYLRMLHIPEYQTIRKETIGNLADAFVSGDRKKASWYTQRAYSEALRLIADSDPSARAPSASSRSTRHNGSNGRARR